MSIKINTLLLISLVVLAFIIINTNISSSKNSEYKDLSEIKSNIILSTNISQVLHAIQKERGLSSGYISSNASSFELLLNEQRIKTDKKINILKNSLAKIKNTSIRKYLEVSLNEFFKVSKLRQRVDSLEIESMQSVKHYTKITNKFLKTIKLISKLSKVPFITKKITAYVNFLYLKENTGVERAIGTMLLSEKSLNYKEIFRFNQLIAIQQLFLDSFLEYTSSNTVNFYNKTLSYGLKEVEQMRNVILNMVSENKPTITQDYWFKQMTLKINKLKLIDDYIAKEIISDIKFKASNAQIYYFIFNILNILSIISFLILIFLIYTKMKSVKRLKLVTDKYIINSITDSKGIITSASEAFCNISGYTQEELLGKPHNITRHPDMPKSTFKDMWDTISSGQIWTGQVKNLKKNGEYYWVYANIEPIFDSKGKIKSYIAVRLDITNSKELEDKIKHELEKNKFKEQQLMQQSRLAQMGEMLAMIAHQWRQPLAAISSTSTALELKAYLGKINKETIIEQSKNITRYSKHLSSTIDDFRDFFKPEKEKKEVSYDEVIDLVMGIIQVSIENQNIQIVKELNNHNKFKTYPNELRQVILNLLKNAEDILLEKDIQNPYIKLVSYTQDSKEILEIYDNAGGVPENIIDKIFDPYFSTKLEKNGTGLGLYMSKTIIEEHCDGILSVRNNENGAIFTITLNN